MFALAVASQSWLGEGEWEEGGSGRRGGVGGGGEWEEGGSGRRGGVGGGGGEWGELRSISLVFVKSILLIRVQGYRGLTEKWKTVKTVHTIRYSVLKISECFRGVVFCESFGIYGAAYLGNWCSVSCHIQTGYDAVSVSHI